jgi:hypothetical protein
MLIRESGSDPSALLDTAARTYHRYPAEGPWIVRSIDGWEDRRGGFAAGQAQAFIVRGLEAFPPVDIPSVDPTAQTLIAASRGVAYALDIPAKRLAGPLRRLFGFQ